MSFSGSKIATITNGNLLNEFIGNKFVIDSRNVEAGDIFLALPGEKLNGHQFVAQAIKNGAAGAIVSYIPEDMNDHSPLVVVSDVKKALIALAKFKRESIPAKFIAITGSVGKTSTKEMLKMILERSGKTFASFANYNNDLGVPICMASIPNDTKFAVLEAGMNQPGEISHLSHLIKPNISIITNVEPVHLWSFKNLQGIALEKASIVDGLVEGGVAIINSECKEFNSLLSYLKQNNTSKIIVGSGQNCEILSTEILNSETIINARIFDKKIIYKLSHTAEQLISNSLLALTTAYTLGLDLEKSAEALYYFKPLKGRGETSKLNSGQTLIDDSYNANPASLAAALKNLSQYPGKKLAIIADMLELGDDAVKLHEQIYQPDIFKRIDGVACLGEMMEHLYVLLPKAIQDGYFKKFEELSDNILTLIQNYDVILVKGSKGTLLYKIIEKIRKEL
jgi:UDP-N-acetylmuramoyl-tripeptide--D-alanyl-D-alanine ligase